LATQQASTGAPTIRVAAMASAAAAIEWYDFFIYGTAAALVFPKLFFPAGLPLFIAQIAAFSTFGVGFIARPIGGALFGHIGDLYGRKRALVFAMLIMGMATTAIGLLPGYARIGGFAPLLLVVLRFVQGLAVGGQWGAAALIAIESAPRDKQGFYGSFVQIGVPLGLVLANIVFLVVNALVDGPAFLVWGWRIGFLLSVSLVFISLYAHWHVAEPVGDGVRVEDEGDGDSAVEQRGSPLATLFRHHWRVVLLAGGAFAANNSCFYVAITYAIAYGTATVGLSREVMLFAVLFGSVAMIPMLILCGALSDRLGRRGIFILGAILSGLWAFVAFPLIETRSPLLVTVAITVELLFISLMYGPQAALFAELFPKSVRYSGASLGYQLGTVIGGGLAPIIATALFARYQSTAAISVYLLIMCIISLVSVILLGRSSPARRAQD
jgi:MFS family permease